MRETTRAKRLEVAKEVSHENGLNGEWSVRTHE